MSETNLKDRIKHGEKRGGFVPGILTYRNLMAIMLVGAVRVDAELREKAKAREPKSRNRRRPEVIYQWSMTGNEFWMRLYTTLDADRLVTRAQRTGKANIRITVRDSKSKKVVEFVSGSMEIARDQKGWENDLKKLLDRAYLFISRERPQCPLCRKAKMEIRSGSRGQFWGCETFPACRGTLNIPEAAIVAASVENTPVIDRKGENYRPPAKFFGNNKVNLPLGESVQ
jgi:hypothetical protein